MKRTPVLLSPDDFPAIFHPWIKDAPLFDSSCSQEAQVLFIDRESGFYLKSAPAGSLNTEAQQTRFFHQKGLGPEVLEYISLDRDWLLTRRIPGEDCTYRQYLDDPARLSTLLGELLRKLHETDHRNCPLRDHTKQYLNTVWQNHAAGLFDSSGRYHSCANREEAIAIVREFAPHLKRDTLLHGDYCLPNIMLDNWRFSGFIDVGRGGIGDRHVDLYWGAWSLLFNLKDDRWCSRFLDAYGRELIQPELLRAIGAFELFG